jgi:hypothetical protein
VDLPQYNADAHYILLAFLWLVAVVIAWFAILFTGRYPEGLFDFVLGVFRWTNGVVAYAFLLVTDLYPPFRLSVPRLARRYAERNLPGGEPHPERETSNPWQDLRTWRASRGCTASPAAVMRQR